MQNKGYDLDFLDKLKSANDIVSVISQYATLQKKGKLYWACCPFHYEKTASFAVNEMEQYYHCFGCGESGDVIKFIQKIEALDFMGAVKLLADRAGLEVPKFQGDENLSKLNDQKKRLYNACNLAMQHYQQNLPTSSIAQEYLKKRQLDDEMVKLFCIGYSAGWTQLIDFLKKNKVSEYDMQAAGLVDKKTSGYYDVMAERLMFPIINSYGDCIGFTARALDDAKFAKYRNTTQTLIFDKSRTVYNINNVKKAKQSHGIDNIIICEGAMDVIAMVKAGFDNTVACMGTAITPMHAKEIKRFAGQVIMCLDGDFAGQKATFRALDILGGEGLDVRVVTLPENLDPDEFLKKYGAEKLREYIENAVVATDFKLKILANKYNLKNNYEVSKYLKEALEIIKQLPTSAEQEIYLKLVRDLTGISIDSLKRDLGYEVKSQSIVNEDKTLEVREEAILRATKFVLASMLHKKDYADIPIDKMYFKNSNYQKLYNFIIDKRQNGQDYKVSDIFTIFDIDEDKDIADIVDYNFENISNLEKYFVESLDRIRRIGLEYRQEELKEMFKKETDINKRREIAVELTIVTKELKK